MSKKIINMLKMIMSNKRYKYSFVITIMLLFISIIGYSLSFFYHNTSKLVANIKVNNLSFNITTNSGESDDRILHLQNGMIESFTSTLTNLNEADTKYELLYDICGDSSCTIFLNSLPDNVKIECIYPDTSMSLDQNDSTNIIILTNNQSENDVYIKLNINAGYKWNDLELVNQIKPYEKSTEIIAYVDGVVSNSYPDSCNYLADIKAYNGEEELNFSNASVECDFTTQTWHTKFDNYASKIVIYFSAGINPKSFAEDSWTKISEVIKHGLGSKYKVGEEKEVFLNDNYYTVRIANNSKPEECNRNDFSQTACGFVIEFVDIPETGQINDTDTNIGGWKSAKIRSYLNSDFINKLSPDLHNVIIDTTVVSGHGSRETENFISTDKIYLLSAPEIWDTDIDTSYNYTRQLDYYVKNNTSSFAIKKYNNANTNWWTRTPYGTSHNFIRVYTNGAQNNNAANATYGIAPAFRIG